MFWEAPNLPLHRDCSPGETEAPPCSPWETRERKKGKLGEGLARVGLRLAAPGMFSEGWLCPFQVGQEMGAAVPAPSPCHQPVKEGFSRGTTTQSHRELGEDGAA